jgi:hypothetical protein
VKNEKCKMEGTSVTLHFSHFISHFAFLSALMPQADDNFLPVQGFHRAAGNHLTPRTAAMNRTLCLAHAVVIFVALPVPAVDRPVPEPGLPFPPAFSVLDDVLHLPPPFGRGLPMLPPLQPNQMNQPRPRFGPWQGDVHVTQAGADGIVTRLHTFERAGVPTVARLKDGRLMAAFQNFPKDDQANFDKVAVSFSVDEGRTWTTPATMVITGMEQGLMRPFDPTLVPLPDGRVRMYFTSNRSPRFEESTPAIYSAISEDGLHYTFEPGVRFGVEGKVVIDCAVCLHQGVFHLFSPDNGTPAEMREEQIPGRPRAASGLGYHATSKDGLNFERMPDVKIEGASNLRWLGNVISDGTTMTFIGTGSATPRRGGIWMATSKTGTEWSLMEPPVIVGADPGIVPLKDGTSLVVSTAMAVSGERTR